MFQILAEINSGSLRDIREANFPHEYILPDNFFINPTLHIDNAADDFFLIEEYVLLGQRSEDSDNYETVKAIIYDLLAKTDLVQISASDPWIMEIGNVDRMFNYFESKEQYKAAKKGRESKEIVKRLRSRIKIQRDSSIFFTGNL